MEPDDRYEPLPKILILKNYELIFIRDMLCFQVAVMIALIVASNSIEHLKIEQSLL